MTDVYKGKRIGNYVLLKVLGTGGFAHVFLGEHIYLKRLNAIKMISTHIQGTEQDNFLKEAQHIAKLEHPNIIRVMDFGIDEGVPYLVMEYAPHGTLYGRHKNQQVPLEMVVNYVKQIAKALYHAHSHGLIHRDVKPPNLLVGKQHEILLGDFGIALLAQSFRKPIDASGTLLYMAPEQLEGRPCFASDQYALAIITYQWLSGLPPFRGAQQELFAAHLFAPPPPLRARVPGLAREVEQVIQRALSKQPQKRFETVLEFAKALEVASQQTAVDPYAPTLLPIVPAHPVSQYQAPTALQAPMSIKQEGAEGTMAKRPAARARVVAFSQSKPVEKEKGSLYEGHTGWVTDVGWSPNGVYLASGSWDETVQVWSAWDRRKIFGHHGHTQPVKAVSWSPDGIYLASGSWDETVQVWHVERNELVFVLGPLGTQIETVRWSPDGSLLAAADHKGEGHVWNSQGQHLGTYQGHHGPIWALAWAPEGHMIATASYDGTVQVWNADSGGTIFTYQEHHTWVSAVSWSITGIASAGHDGVIHIWDVLQGGTRFIYRGHSQGVKALAWSSDGKYIASGDREIQIWDASTGRCFVAYKEQKDWINAIAWSMDGQYLASGSDDQTILVREVGNLF